MIRNCSLEEISDGKLYSENDMVKADTNQCQGCNSVCCHGMGDSIVLDPYDICRLTRQLQMPFESLVEKHLALNVVDGVILPNQKMAGEGHYRVKYLMDNTQGIYDELIENFYAYPALQPPMTWLDNVPPSAPSTLKVTSIDNGYTELNWQAATDNDQRNKPMYVIYASNEYPVDTKKAENIVAQSIRETSYIYAPIQPWNAKKYFAVTAIDRCGNESAPVYGD